MTRGRTSRSRLSVGTVPSASSPRRARITVRREAENRLARSASEGNSSSISNVRDVKAGQTTKDDGLSYSALNDTQQAARGIGDDDKERGKADNDDRKLFLTRQTGYRGKIETDPQVHLGRGLAAVVHY